MQSVRDLAVRVVVSDEDLRAITDLYPAKSEDEKENMLVNSLRPEFDAQVAGDRLMLLAVCQGSVVGTVQAVWSSDREPPSLLTPGTCVIHHLRTHPQFECRGIAHRLVAAVESIARARGCTRIALGVEPDNEHARAIYQHWGFRELMRYHGANGESIIGMARTLVA